jgi:hypothetical protein
MRRISARLLQTGVLFAAIALSYPASAQAPARYRFAGFISDTHSAPVGNARVLLTTDDGSPHYQLTDDSGHFAFPSLPAGKAELSVRRLGFQPITRAIVVGGPGVPDSAHVLLTPLASELASVDVVERMNEGTGAPREFYDRQKSNHFGRFLDSDALEKSQARYLSDALRNVPGVRVLPSRRIGYLVRIRGCRPTVWMDGVRTAGAEVDEVATMADISGVEIYNSLAGLPPQYIDRDNPCGAILVWSRTR